MSWRPNFTEPQARHVETVLRLIDKAIERVDYLLDRGIFNGGAAGAQSRLTPEGVAALKEAFHRLQTEGRSLYAKYGLRGRRPDVIRVLDAELSSLWEMLEDTRPGAMSGYGPMDPETASVLEHDMARLVERVLEIRRRVLQIEEGAAAGPEDELRPRKAHARPSPSGYEDDENSAE